MCPMMTLMKHWFNYQVVRYYKCCWSFDFALDENENLFKRRKSRRFKDHCIKFLSLFLLAGVISQWQSEPKERVISLVLTHLPLLKPGNIEAKGEYMRLLPRILAHTIEHGHHLEESRQLLSYALIHPATSLEDRAALALWLNHLEERAAARGDSLERPPPSGPHHHHQSTPPSTLTSSGSSSSSTNNSSSGNLYLHHHQRYGSDDRLNGWQSSRDSGLGGGWHQQQQSCENGHLLLYPSSSVPATINTVGTGGGGNTSKLTPSLGLGDAGRITCHDMFHQIPRYGIRTIS